jgi:hypothetical protein
MIQYYLFSCQQWSYFSNDSVLSAFLPAMINVPTDFEDAVPFPEVFQI